MFQCLVLSTTLFLGQQGGEPAGGAPAARGAAGTAGSFGRAVGPAQAEPAGPPAGATLGAPTAEAPAPAPPAPAAPAPAATDRWLLMKTLQGTWPGALLDGH